MPEVDHLRVSSSSEPQNAMELSHMDSFRYSIMPRNSKSRSIQQMIDVDLSDGRSIVPRGVHGSVI